jgi:hypothetical protein
MSSRAAAIRTALAIGLLGRSAFAQDAGALDVCQRWAGDRADLTEGSSTANVASCTPGTYAAPGPANSLKLVNLYRYLASMPPVTEDSSYDAYAQACAVLQAANYPNLTHSPTSSNACYSAAADTGSQHSSVCSDRSVACIDLYMSDGQESDLGHRRWILANFLGPVGFGSVGGAGGSGGQTGSCFYQPAGTSLNLPYVAWPPAGNVPLAALQTTHVDTSGWSIQSDSINLGSATVSVVDGTTSRPVTVSVLPQYLGSTYAIRFVPSGWTSQAGHSYTVSLAGTSIAYTVNVVDCSSVDGGTGDGGSLRQDASGEPTDASAHSSDAMASTDGDATEDSGGSSGVNGSRDAALESGASSTGVSSSGASSRAGEETGSGASEAAGNSGCGCSTAGRARPNSWHAVIGALAIIAGIRSGRRRRSAAART